MGRIVGEPLQPDGDNAEFFSGAASGATFARGADGTTQVTSTVAGIGESLIARSEKIRRQGPERVMAGAPKFYRVKNRATQGHVQVWMGVFNGEAYPDGAIGDDKHTWLQPGDEMLIPLEAALHFFGNVFDPRAPEAMEIIERCGGFELETQKSNPGKNPEVRVIGGPIGLPDFVITPIDGRFKVIGNGVPLYAHYWDAVRKRVLKSRKDKDPEILATEKLLLADRIREYTLEDDPEDGALFGPGGEVLSTTETREDAALDRAPDMRERFENNDDEQAEDLGQPAGAASPSGRRASRARAS